MTDGIFFEFIRPSLLEERSENLDCGALYHTSRTKKPEESVIFHIEGDSVKRSCAVSVDLYEVFDRNNI
ncbi:MAG: hypothetical protein NTX46_01140 [Chloroflexi bacterium]|nr:hypothetical protein [Chloroflexota bacterium]